MYVVQLDVHVGAVVLVEVRERFEHLAEDAARVLLREGPFLVDHRHQVISAVLQH